MAVLGHPEVGATTLEVLPQAVRRVAFVIKRISRRTWRLTGAGIVAAAVAGAWCVRAGDRPATHDGPAAAAATTLATRGPLAAYRLYVDPATDAAAQVRRWEAQGRSGDARVLRRIADRP